MMYFCPSLRLISRQSGGKIELTVTRFAFSMPASRSASSNEERRSLCTPAPCVKKIAFGSNISLITGKPLSPIWILPGFVFVALLIPRFLVTK